MGPSVMELIVTPLRQMALPLVHENVLGASMMRVFVQRSAWHQAPGASMRALLQQKVLPSDHRSSASNDLRWAASTWHGIQDSGHMGYNASEVLVPKRAADR